MTAQTIARLNDAFRNNCTRIFFAGELAMSGPETKALAIAAVRKFSAFTSDNDPHGEHDFGEFSIFGRKAFWKIDYYAAGSDFGHGSPDPSDDEVTDRALTILYADDY